MFIQTQFLHLSLEIIGMRFYESIMTRKTKQFMQVGSNMQVEFILDLIHHIKFKMNVMQQ